MTPPHLTLDSADALASDLVGRKAAVLARLRMAGHRTPDGLVLAVDAPDAAVSSFVDAISDTFDGPVAVRGSAPWEDHRTRSAAGQTLTILHVNGAEDLAAAVRDVRDAPSPRGRDGRVAVLVQAMLDPSHAGIAFTADPMTGGRDVVRIAATAGLGDAVAAGMADGIDVSVRGDQVHGDRQDMPADDVHAVASLAREVEMLLGGPQDLEWAICDGQVWLLQARPITALPVAPEPLEGHGWAKDTSHYSGPLTPFGFTVLQAAEAGMEAGFSGAGFIIDGAEERSVGGEVYSRIIPAFGSPDPPPVNPPAAVLGALARVLPPLRKRTGAAARTLAQLDDDAPLLAEWRRRRPDFVAAAEELVSQDMAALDVRGLLAHRDRLLGLVAEGGRLHFATFPGHAVTAHQLHELLADRPGWSVTDTTMLLSGSSPATVEGDRAMAALRHEIHATAGAVDAVAALPDQPVGALRSVDPTLADRLQRWIDRHAWRARNYDAGVPVLAERPRSITRLLLADPLADGGAGSTPDGGASKVVEERARQLLPSSSHAAFDRALHRARTWFPVREDTAIIAGDVPMGLLRRWLVEVGIRLVRAGVLGHAEDAAYLEPDELAEALSGTLPVDEVADRVVRRRGEEAWARANPGPMTIGRQGGPPDISALPDPLRQVNEAALWVVGLEFARDLEGGDAGGDVLVSGTATSPGVVEGTARVVLDEDDLDRLTDGDILVCRTSSPGWAPMFGLIRGLVADTGGALSHAAIASREHGIPAVAATGRATTAIRDGQRIRVDGTQGVVTAA